MALWTNLQKNYVRDIEKNVGVEFEGNPTRKDADLFIKEHAEENKQIKLDLNKRFPPTGKQLRLIKDIEEELDIKFKGRTIRTASKFIDEYIDEYKCSSGSKNKMRNLIYKKAREIGRR